MPGTSRHSEEFIKRSLRIKLARLVAAVVLVTAGALIVGGFLSLRGILRNEARVRLQTELVGRQRLLDAYIRQQFERAKLVASRTQLRRLLEEYLDGTVDLTVFADRTTRIISDACDSMASFIDIWITDSNGKVISSTDPQRMGESFADHAAFTDGKINPVLLPPKSNGAIHRSIVASPAFSDTDRFLGVVMVSLNVDDMNNMLKADLLESATTEVLVGMRSGKSVEVFFTPAEQAALVEQGAVPGLAAAVSGKTGFEKLVDYKGKEVLAAYRPVGYGGWGLAVTIDVDEAYAPIATLRMWSILISLIVLIVAVSLAFITAGKFARPIRRLTNAATALADGDYSARAEIDSNDELGVLGQIFNDTAAALQKHQEHLEELVQQRTTQLQSSVEELEDSRAIFRSLVEGLPLHIFRKDIEGRFVFCNERFAGSMDRTVEEVVGKTDYDFFPQEQADKYRDDDQKVMSTRTTFHDIEAHLEHGQQHYAEVVKTPVYDHRNEVTGVQGAFWDVTDRKRAQEEIAQSQAIMRQILDTALDAFISMDAKGNIVDWNPRAEETFGWKREEVLGQSLAQMIVPPQFRDDHVRGLSKFLVTGEGPVLGKRIELVALHKAGHEFPVELTITAMTVDGTHRFNAFIHDIAARKQREQALHATQEELKAAKNVAESANQAKSDFLANMSHEIRTPMNGVLGMIELLLNTTTSTEQSEYLKLAKGSAEALLDILNDILDFSKIDAGKMELDLRSFALRDSIGDTLHTLTLRAAEKGLELAFHIPSAVPERLIGDQGRLRQVIVNLVGNAIKFTDHGEVLVDVALKEEESDQVHLHFKVIDTGIGIQVDKQAAIFESFAQADTSTTREYGGTGLGLAISRRLVELMGGRIWVESHIGRGSTFQFIVPFQRDQRNGDLSVPTSEELRGLPVLIVDDNATNRLILEEMVLSWRMQPIVASDADMALDIIDSMENSNDPIRIALLDCMMPRVDGLELAKRIRERSKYVSLPLLLLSSGTRSDDIARARALGVSQCMPKPIKPSDLLDAMLLALHREKSKQMSDASDDDVSRPLRRLKVLLAEDTRVNQQVAVRLLEKRGHSVAVVDNGKLAVERCAVDRFDAVLMDVQMPEMDGLQATAAIRDAEKKTGAHVPIIAMTAHALKGDRQRCLDAGMDDYLPKPVRANELYAVLERIADANFGKDGDESTELADDAPNALVDSPVDDAAITPVREETNSQATAFVHLDLKEALDHVGDDEPLLRELAGIFLADIVPMMKSLAAAIAAKDSFESRRLSHAVKGLSLNFGADETCKNAAALEALAKVEDWNAIPALWQTVQEQVEALTIELQQWLIEETE